MSDFPMPEDLSKYNPKTQRGLAAVAEALSDPVNPFKDYKTPKKAEKIREALKELTHREMRDMCVDIFKAAQGDTISKADLPDVLDKFAYGD